MDFSDVEIQPHFDPIGMNIRMIWEAMKQDGYKIGGGKTMDRIVKNLLCTAIILFAAISLASAT